MSAVESKDKDKIDRSEAGGSASAEQQFLDRLRCPVCELDMLQGDRYGLTCAACGEEYQSKNGVLNLDPEGYQSIDHWIYGLEWYSENYERGRRQLTNIRSARTLEQELELSTVLLNLDDDSTVLDIACGTATFTRHFGQHIADSAGDDNDALIVGTDLSQTQLEQGRKYLAEEGLDDWTFLFRSNATSLPVRHESFDRLHCAASLHLMGDGIDMALRHFARALEPGGICVIQTWLVPQEEKDRNLYRRVAGWVQRTLNRNFHLFERDELRERIERAGMSVVTTSVSQQSITLKARREK